MLIDVVLRSRDDARDDVGTALFRSFGTDIVVRLYPKDYGRDTYDVQLRAATLVIEIFTSGEGVGSVAGVAVVTGTGASLGVGDAASAGVAVATGIAVAFWSSTGASNGTGVAAAVGIATATSTAASTGTASVTGVGAVLFLAIASSTGAGDAIGYSAPPTDGVGTSSGTASVTGVGIATGAGVASAAGVATGLGLSAAFPTQIFGLKAYYNAAVHDLCLVNLADAPPGMGGVIRIDKNGTSYVVYLVEIGDLNATPIRVSTATGIKAVRVKT